MSSAAPGTCSATRECALDRLPRQGSRPPWRISPTYTADVKLLRRQPVANPELRFEPAKETVPS